MPIGLIGALLGTVVGDEISASSAQGINQANIGLAQQQMNWQTQMSDTAMQRRVADLKAAGLNPMLATGTPGASMGMPVMPNLQNPGAAFGNLGGQLTSAMQLATQSAQIEQMKAQADLASAGARKTNVETDTVIPETVKNIQANTGLSLENTQKVSADLRILDTYIAMKGPEADAAMSIIKQHLMEMDSTERSATLDQLIKARNSSNYAARIGAENMSNAQDSDWGRIMALFNTSAPAISSAQSLLQYLTPKSGITINR